MRRHIERVGAEFPAMEPDLIERIYQQLVVALLRQPTEDEYRARVAELSVFDDATLRDMLWLPPKARASRWRRRSTAPVSGDGRGRRPGRPGWTAGLFWDRYREAREQVGPPHAHKDIAGSFRGLDGERGIDPDHLRRLLRRFDLPPA
jgi:hypothetical protein